MPTPTNLRDQLLRDEGTRLKVYFDSEGIATIGVGRNLVSKGISLAESDFMLDNDISEVTAAVLSSMPWTARMDEARRAVLINLAFNVGLQGLLRFQKALVATEAGDWFTAAAHLMDSRWAGQVGIRAERLAEQLRTGAWQ